MYVSTTGHTMIHLHSNVPYITCFFWIHHDRPPLKCWCLIYFGVLVHITYKHRYLSSHHHRYSKSKPSILLDVSHRYDDFSPLPSTWICCPMDPLRTPMPWRMVSRCVEVPLRLESPSSLISRRCLGSWGSWFFGALQAGVLGGYINVQMHDSNAIMQVLFFWGG